MIAPDTKDDLEQTLGDADLAFLRDASAELPDIDDDHRATFSDVKDIRHERRARGREFLKPIQLSAATQHLLRLPKPGWTLHGLTAGNYHAFDLIPAILTLIDPATIRHLHIATLSYNTGNGDDLIKLIDEGKIERVTLVCSTFFMAHKPHIHGPLAIELTQRGHRCLATRMHAKVNTIETTDGRYFTLEGSANLGSCHGVEQFCLTNDRGLYDFHRGWIDSLFQ